MKNADHVFDSQTEKTYQLATGHISKTVILFEREQLYAEILAEGQVTLYDAQGNVLAKDQAPLEESGRKVYEEVTCRVEDGSVILEFPIYQWIDHYPNCDGEHDRWSTRKVGSHSCRFENMVKNT